jgi:hypothetical protein
MIGDQGTADHFGVTFNERRVRKVAFEASPNPAKPRLDSVFLLNSRRWFRARSFTSP